MKFLQKISITTHGQPSLITSKLHRLKSKPLSKIHAIWNNLHSCVFQRAQIALVLRACTILILFEKHTRLQIISKLNSKPYDYLYKKQSDKIINIIPTNVLILVVWLEEFSFWSTHTSTAQYPKAWCGNVVHPTWEELWRPQSDETGKWAEGHFPVDQRPNIDWPEWPQTA